jgi:D-alanyl-D-alanine carboxypeptidase/D-alanyl-D-alanine-endopeptidase (penicillin-binding protein 4)
LSTFLILALALAPPATGREAAPLARRLDAIVENGPLAGALWGVEVRELRSGRVLYSRNARRQFAPASSYKLLSTAAALDALGPDLRLRTTVESAARLDDAGGLLGDLLIVGRGDFTLSTGPQEGGGAPALEDLAAQVAQAGVRRVSGRVLGLDTLVAGERRPSGWTWEDLVWCYGAEVSGLSIDGNCGEVVASPGERPGDPLRLELRPAPDHHEVVSSALTAPAGSKPELALQRPAGANRILLSGALPVGAAPQTLSVALEDPARHVARLFSAALEARGVVVEGEPGSALAPPAGQRRVLAERESPPLSELIRAVNKPSYNLGAEVLLRLVALYCSDPEAEALERALQRLGVDEKAALVDGSGLARSDLLSPRLLVELLVAMRRHPQAEAYRASLPVAGVDGTLRGRFKGTPVEGRLRAKTGSINHVASLAGYLERPGGQELVFAVLVNGALEPAAPTIDRLVLELLH